MGVMSWLGRRSSAFDYASDPSKPGAWSRSTTRSVPQWLRAIPETEAGWQQRYGWLWDWYLGAPYSQSDVAALSLFRASDVDGNLIAMAQRLTRDAQFVVDTDVHALAGGRWSLDLAGGRTGGSGLIREGEAVWRRSQLQSRRASWLRAVCAMGDAFLEAVRTEGGTRIVAYDPRHVAVEYSPDGMDLLSATIRIPYIDPEGVPRVYERHLTRDAIEVTEQRTDGGADVVQEESGEHGLGVVPMVHLQCQQIVGIPEHSLWSGHGLDLYTAAMDSMMAQLRAIATRYAHPHIVAKGVRLGDTSGDGGGLEQFGRIFNGLPDDASVEYLEAGMGAIQPIYDVVRQYGDSVRATIPEFTLAGSGANTSGRALEFRADQFRRKMRDLATRTHAQVARITEYAVLMQRGQPYSGQDRYRIGAPPPLPIDDTQRVTLVQQAMSAGLMTRADGVRHMQAVGLVDEEIDAQAYADGLEPTPPSGPDPGPADTDGRPNDDGQEGSGAESDSAEP